MDALTPPPPARTAPGPARAPRGLVLVAAVASFVVALDLLVLTTALEAIRTDLAVDPGSLQWIVTAYGVAFASLMLVATAVADRWGRRRTFVAGLLVFAAGSAAAALSTGLAGLVAARILQGAGAAFVLPVGLAIVSVGVPPSRRGAAIGAVEGISGVAVIAGPLVGGALAAHLSWQWIFWVNVPIALMTVPAAFAVVRETRGPVRPIDLHGAALVAAGVAGLVYAVARGTEQGWRGAQLAVVLLATAACGAAAVRRQRRAAHPLLPPRLFRRRAFSAGVIAAGLLSAALYGSVYFMAQLLQVVLHLDPQAAGVRLVPWTATLLVVAPAAGALADRVGARPVLVCSLVTAAAGFAGMAAVVGPEVGYGALLPAMLLAGLGVSGALPVVQAVVIGAVGEDDVATAAGTTTVLQEIGGALGVAVVVAVFLAGGGYGSAAAFADGFAGAIAACGALAAGAAAAALAIPRGAARDR